MENPSDHEHQRLLLLRAIRHAQIGLGELWLHYFAIGGDAGEYEVEAYLHGSFTLPPLQRDLLAHAANELIDDRPPPPRAPYSTDEPASEHTPSPDSGSGGYGPAIAYATDAGDGDAEPDTSKSASSAGSESAGDSFAGIEEDKDGDTGWTLKEGTRGDGSDSS
ncbi:hypothetical protein [Arthrobacter sp. MSA 4-2]|uniref:hypothetical protein n=1 Tax=Arthrobacter sp. MSA 4-2 TaxID=2794349 RepID=UPI0027DC36D0|nr:hypothetical protein [Arthrobacter sp. MSA 4-2]